MSITKILSRGFELLCEPGSLSYALKAKKVSVASYKMCRALRSVIAEPALILDVGANQGQFACACRWWFPEVKLICFEPSPRAFGRLDANMREFERVELHNIALGKEEGEIEFFESEYSHASSVLQPTELQRELNPASAMTRRMMVQVRRLDQVCRSHIGSGGVLLKLDVQGFERAVLEGATGVLASVDWLLFECSFRPMYEGEATFAEMYAFVGELGYELIGLVGHLEDPNGLTLQADLLWRRRGSTGKTVRARLTTIGAFP